MPLRVFDKARVEAHWLIVENRAGELPIPAEESALEVEAALAPYINAYREYVIRCATEFAPQANDFGDCESFIYLQPGTFLVTSDDRWVEIAQAVCPTQIIVPIAK